MSSKLHIIYIFLFMFIVSCGGSDDDGGSSSTNNNQTPQFLNVSLDPTFTSIQDELFTPTCAASNCHSGNNPPEGLDLSAGSSLGMLVNIPSNGVPSLDRVEPGDSENSYIIWKLEGRTGISGQQMPRGGPFLEQAQIDIIAQWINNGATAFAAPNNVKGFQVVSVSPSFASSLSSRPNKLVIVFNQKLDQTKGSPDSFALQGSGFDGSFSDGNELEIDLPMPSFPKGNPNTVVIDLSGIDLAADTYQIKVDSRPDKGISDLGSQFLNEDYISYFQLK